MDAYRQIMGRGEVISILESIHLKKVSSSDITGFGEWKILFDDVDTVRTHLHLVADLVIALIDPVEREVHKLGSRWVFHTDEIAHLRSDGVSDERLVGGIGQQCPFLGLCIAFTQEFLFLIKLDFVRFLGQIPCGVTPSSDLHGVELQHIVLLIHIEECAIDVIVLTCYPLVIESVDIDGRKVCKPFIFLCFGVVCSEKAHCQHEIKDFPFH